MQRLWSRAAPAQSSCRCVSCLHTGANGLTSRATSAASKRRLRFGNSVTAFYSSIFAAAALADAQAKDQRRLEWKEKIAAVKEEVNELVDEEKRILEAIASRRKQKLFNGAFHTRQYSTLIRPAFERFPKHLGYIQYRSFFSESPPMETPATSAQEREEPNFNNTSDVGARKNSVEDAGKHLNTTKGGLNEEFKHNSNLDPDDFDASINDLVDRPAGDVRESQVFRDLVDHSQDPMLIDDGIDLEDDVLPTWLEQDIIRMKVIRKLATKQLAIRILLRPAIAHSYLGLRMKYEVDFEQPQMKVTELLHELNQIRRRLRHLKTERNAYIEDIARDIRVRDVLELAQENIKLDQEVRFDVETFLVGKILLPELLIRLANNLLKATDPDRSFAMRMMLIAFSKSRQNDLGDLVLKTLLSHKFPLTSSVILSIITFYRHSKNLRGFDMFMEMLRGHGFPVDMKELGYYKLNRINGVEISVPPVNSANAVVYSTLILACLRFDQPERADAYSQAGRAIGYMDDFTTLVAYLKFYAIRTDWEKGSQAIKRSLAFLSSSTQHSGTKAARLVAMMVHLCDSCQMYKVSEAIIVAAVKSGFDWRAAEQNEDIEFPFDPEFRRWHAANDLLTRAEADAVRNKLKWEKYYMFVNAVSEQINDLVLPEQTGSARAWHKLMGTYSQEVLSAVTSGPPAEYRLPESGSEPVAQQTQALQFKAHQDKLEEVEITAQEQQEEISTLKAEVTQLKQMVFELSARTAATKKSRTPASARAPTQDMAELKNNLISSMTGVEDEASNNGAKPLRKVNIRRACQN